MMISSEELLITKCNEEEQVQRQGTLSRELWVPFPKSEGFWLWRRISGVVALLDGVSCAATGGYLLIHEVRPGSRSVVLKVHLLYPALIPGRAGRVDFRFQSSAYLWVPVKIVLNAPQAMSRSLGDRL